MSTPIQRLQQLFEQAQASFHPDTFAEEASSLLKKLNFSPDEMEELLKQMITMPAYPKQTFGRTDFGFPGITLFSNGSITLDIYVWTFSNLSIHSHNFNGAFRLLQGKSYHQVFTFDLKKELCDSINSGELRLVEREDLLPGDVRTIEHENKFIHSIFHTERPSITLCLRTIGVLKPLSIYLYPSVQMVHQKEFELACLKRLDLMKLLPESSLAAQVAKLKDRDLSVCYYLASEEKTEQVLKVFEEVLLQRPWGKEFIGVIDSHHKFSRKYRNFVMGGV